MGQDRDLIKKKKKKRVKTKIKYSVRIDLANMKKLVMPRAGEGVGNRLLMRDGVGAGRRVCCNVFGRELGNIREPATATLPLTL